MRYKIYNLFHHEDGKISNNLYRKLREIDKSCDTFSDRYCHMKDILLSFYGDSSKYSIDDIMQRKIYLETEMENKSTCFSSLAISFFVWGLCEYIADLPRISFTSLYDFWNQVWTILQQNIVPAIFLIFLSIVVAKVLCRQDTLYRKYNLIDFELKIINRILEKEYNYDGVVEDILISRDRSSGDETEIQDAELPNSGS